MAEYLLESRFLTSDKLNEAGKENLLHCKIGVLGTIWPSLPLIYRLGILKHLKTKSILMKNESIQHLNENLYT